MPKPLPNTNEALELLRKRGIQFTDDSPVFHLPNGYIIDTRALEGMGKVYTADDSIARAVRMHSKPAQSISKVLTFLKQRYSQGVVWGFSGFSMGEFDYEAEADGMISFFRHLRDRRMSPSLIIDGGCSEGVLGLSGVIARRYLIGTLGFIPKEGLTKMAPRSGLVIHEATYQDREKYVGSAPDALVCWGGKDGTKRECEAAIKAGSPVIVVDQTKYRDDVFPRTYRSSKFLRDANEKGQLIVCRPNDDLGDCIDNALARLEGYKQAGFPQREARLAELAKYFG